MTHPILQYNEELEDDALQQKKVVARGGELANERDVNESRASLTGASANFNNLASGARIAGELEPELSDYELPPNMQRRGREEGGVYADSPAVLAKQQFWPRRPRPRPKGVPASQQQSFRQAASLGQLGWPAGTGAGAGQELNSELERQFLDTPESDWYESEAFAEHQRREVPMGALAAYLNAMYGLSPQESVELLTEGLPQQQIITREQLADNLSRIGARRLALRQQERANNGTGPSIGLFSSWLLPSAVSGQHHRWLDWRGSPTSFVAIVLLALVSTCLIVKLIMRKLDERLTRVGQSCRFGSKDAESSGKAPAFRPAFWLFKGRKRANSSCTDDQEDDDDQTGHGAKERGELDYADDRRTIMGLAAHGGAGRQLDEAAEARQLLRKRLELGQSCELSVDSGHETIASAAPSTTSRSYNKLRESLERLAQRCAKLTLGKSGEAAEREREPEALQPPDSEADAGVDVGAPESQQAAARAPDSKSPGGFRTSSSYIRSLIEAITRTTSTQTGASARRASSVDNGPEDDGDPGDASSSSSAGDERRADKCKRLEELESQEVLLSQMDISAAHLILDYMEKHLIDKERLRREWLELNAGQTREGSCSSSTKQQTAPTGPGRNAKTNQLLLQRLAKVALAEENLHKNRDPSVVPFDRNRVRLGRHSSGATGKRAARAGTRRAASDYINASFIYDADPRRPTHIVAQGPTERTCGDFWQVSWSHPSRPSTRRPRCFWATDVRSS